MEKNQTKFFFHICNRSIMSDIQRDNRVVSLSSRAGIRNSLVTLLDQLQRCQKSLNEFLEVHLQTLLCPNIFSLFCFAANSLIVKIVWFLQEKRSAFPRFYFIGDDDLLEILGQATNPSVIQSHLKKLFAGRPPLFFFSCFHHLCCADISCFIPSFCFPAIQLGSNNLNTEICMYVLCRHLQCSV